MSNKFYVITGGPGAGKTTLIDTLKKHGCICIEEGARQIIQEQVRTGGDAVPWNNIKRYKEMMLAHALESYGRALKKIDTLTFFDRSIFDLIAYDRRTQVEGFSDLYRAAETLLYNKKVFIAPPWEEIFCNDDERKQTYQEAIEVYKGIVKVYIESGYQLIELPKIHVAGRIEFIFSHIDTL